MRGPDPSYLGAEQVLSLGYDNDQDEKRFIGQLLILSVKTGSPCHQWPWARYVTNAQSHAPQTCLFCGVQGENALRQGDVFAGSWQMLANIFPVGLKATFHLRLCFQVIATSIF